MPKFTPKLSLFGDFHFSDNLLDAFFYISLPSYLKRNAPSDLCLLLTSCTKRNKITVLYVLANLTNKNNMTIKSVSSTIAKNNFGQVLEDIAENRVRYLVERHGIPKVVILSLEDFSNLLNSDAERRHIQHILQEIKPQYNIGRPLDVQSEI